MVTLVLVLVLVMVMTTWGEEGVTRIQGVHPELRWARDIPPLHTQHSGWWTVVTFHLLYVPLVPAAGQSRKVASWLESYQDLLGQFIPSETTPTPTPTTTPAPRSLLMSLIGDFIPYITGAEGGEGAAGRGEGGTDPGDGLGDSEDLRDSDGDQILRRQGLAFDTRGGPRKRWEN